MISFYVCEEFLDFRLKQFLSLLLRRILSGIGHIHGRGDCWVTYCAEADCMKKKRKIINIYEVKVLLLTCGESFELSPNKSGDDEE